MGKDTVKKPATTTKKSQLTTGKKSIGGKTVIVNKNGSSKYTRFAFKELIDINPIQLIELIRKGLPKKTVDELVEITEFDINEISEIIHLPTVNLSELKETELLTSEQTEKIVQLVKLCEKGESVFEDIELFNNWLRKENKVFQGQVPLNLLDTSIGFQMILDELGRIEHGIFA